MDAVFLIIFVFIYAVSHWLIWGSDRLNSPRKRDDK